MILLQGGVARWHGPQKEETPLALLPNTETCKAGMQQSSARLHRMGSNSPGNPPWENEEAEGLEQSRISVTPCDSNSLLPSYQLRNHWDQSYRKGNPRSLF